MTEKSPDAFRTISEAADELNLPQHVLRFWETRFTPIKPLKRGGNRRYYRPEDVLLLKGIRHLLYDQGFTIKGVQRILKEQGVRQVIAIGETGEIGALADADYAQDGSDDIPEALLIPEAGADNPMSQHDAQPAPRETSVAPGLSGHQRSGLEAVLRDLLECKRLLDRARDPG